MFATILGEHGSDVGTLSLPTTWQIAHMAQEVHATEMLAIDYVLSGDDEWWQLNDKISRQDALSADEIAPIYQRFEEIDGYRTRAKAAMILSGLGFGEAEHTKAVVMFSGGWRMRLNLARTLMHRADVLLLDEPTNGVDPLSRRDFWRILYRLLEEKVTIFVSTAYLDEAERCTKIGLLHKGRMILSGTPDEVKKHMSGALVEIRCNEPRQVLASLRESMTLVAAGLFGAKIHLVLDGDASQALAAVKEKLATLGVEAETEIVVPSLEDVFISQILSSEGSGSDA